MKKLLSYLPAVLVFITIVGAGICAVLKNFPLCAGVLVTGLILSLAAWFCFSGKKQLAGKTEEIAAELEKTAAEEEKKDV